MQAQIDEIARCASSEARHHVWTRERKSHDDGKQMHNSSSVQGGVGGWNVLRTYGAWAKRTEFYPGNLNGSDHIGINTQL